MTCAACDRALLKREHAQPMQVGWFKVWPKSLCDECARTHQWAPGRAEALLRLVEGRTDPDELARVVAKTPMRPGFVCDAGDIDESADVREQAT